MNFTQFPISLEELEKYRDEDGFINLDNVLLAIDESSRNQVGTTDIFKYWVDFAGQKVLLKEEKMLDGEPNFTIYSELIMSELANQVGIQSAKCDLIKYRGKRGILSLSRRMPRGWRIFTHSFRPDKAIRFAKR